MPIPHFTDGEVLSAMRLNHLVAVVNQFVQVTNGFVFPFEQVYRDIDHKDQYWYWMFRYSPVNRYFQVRYQWSNKALNGSIKGYVSRGITQLKEVFSDTAGTGSRISDYTIDLQQSGLSLIPGSVYTFDIDGKAGDSEMLRIIWVYNTNNAGYKPAIYGP